MKTHHVSEEVSVAQLLQLQQVAPPGRVQFLGCQTFQERLHHEVHGTDSLEIYFWAKCSEQLLRTERFVSRCVHGPVVIYTATFSYSQTWKMSKFLIILFLLLLLLRRVFPSSCVRAQPAHGPAHPEYSLNSASTPSRNEHAQKTQTHP